MDAEVRNRIGILCRQISRRPSLVTAIGEIGARPALDELLTALAGPAEPGQARIIELLDAIDHAGKSRGLTGLTSPGKALDAGHCLPPGLVAGPDSLPPGFSGAPKPIGWTCTLRRCDRVDVPAHAADGTPTCAASGNKPLRPYPEPAT